jgi:hypothetical protein
MRGNGLADVVFGILAHNISNATGPEQEEYSQLVILVKKSIRIRLLNCLVPFPFLFLTEFDRLHEIPLLCGQRALLGLFLGETPFALLNRSAKVILFVVTAARGCTPTAAPNILVLLVVIHTRATPRPADHAIAHVRPAATLLTQACLIYEQVGDVLGLLPDVRTLIFAILIDILELLERFDQVDIVSEIYNDIL